ncbi:hypothetical protein CCH79_00004825 [Gambusia affinis]|uniref:Uncharacterized protein n=1 Tax=Gambusia affinis TaxID=33528 RepID=A0A315V6S9_GAMAF|nr:hypothetical protein CCH79_00004825 [Gambusia affinis]
MWLSCFRFELPPHFTPDQLLQPKEEGKGAVLCYFYGITSVFSLKERVYENERAEQSQAAEQLIRLFTAVQEPSKCQDGTGGTNLCLCTNNTDKVPRRWDFIDCFPAQAHWLERALMQELGGEGKEKEWNEINGSANVKS